LVDKNSDISGRGATKNTNNPYLKHSISVEFPEGLDEPLNDVNNFTKIHLDHPKKIVNKVDSPDVPINFSINPYQGCEHGCVYCYARNSHTFWGFSAGLDFEQQIVAKPNAPELLRKYLNREKYIPEAISLSGNTDCYQPIERKLKITRQLLEIFLEYKHPVGIITKNSLVLRDLDILQELAKENLVGVFVSITTLDESLRRRMEPRTSTAANRLKTIAQLSKHGVPVGVMVAPVIPGLTVHELPSILEAASENGALSAGYTMLRLNGQVAELFSDWIEQNYPLKKSKIIGQVSQVHGGKLNDSRWGTRMKGEGPVAEIVKQMFQQSKARHFTGRTMPAFETKHFRITNDSNGQGKLF
jgi:DNA repair photolyase